MLYTYIFITYIYIGPRSAPQIKSYVRLCLLSSKNSRVSNLVVNNDRPYYTFSMMPNFLQII